MVNRNYKNGRAKEYRIVKQLKDEGFIAARSAGSHSPIDVWAIHPDKREIVLVQSKLGYLSKNNKRQIEEDGLRLQGSYAVFFRLVN